MGAGNRLGWSILVFCVREGINSRTDGGGGRKQAGLEHTSV